MSKELNQQEEKIESVFKLSEEKEIGRYSPKKEDSWMQIPIYIGVLLLVLGVVIGFAVDLQIRPSEGQTVIIKENPEIIVKEVLPEFKIQTKEFVSNKFKDLGGEFNTIFLTFASKDMNFERQEIDVDSEEGKKLAKDFNVQFLPTVLVDVNSVKPFAAVNNTFKGVVDELNQFFKKKNGQYFVPEFNSDNIPHKKLFLENPDPTCKDEKGKINVILFDDPYYVKSIKNSVELEKLQFKFDKKIEFEYSYFPTVTGNLILANGVESEKDLEKLPMNFFAAGEQGKLVEFRKCVYEKYCDKDSNGINGEATSEELNNCETGNDKYGKPVDQNIFDACTTELNLDKQKMKEFVEQKGQNTLKEKGNKRAEKFNIFRSDEIVIDCKMVSVQLNTEILGCKLNPEIEQC